MRCWCTGRAGPSPSALRCWRTSPSRSSRPSALGLDRLRCSSRLKTSGSSFATTGCRTACPYPTTPSSITAVMHGTASLSSPGVSCRSDRAIRQTVRPGESGYDRLLACFRSPIRQRQQAESGGRRRHVSWRALSERSGTRCLRHTPIPSDTENFLYEPLDNNKRLEPIYTRISDSKLCSCSH